MELSNIRLQAQDLMRVIPTPTLTLILHGRCRLGEEQAHLPRVEVVTSSQLQSPRHLYLLVHHQPYGRLQSKLLVAGSVIVKIGPCWMCLPRTVFNSLHLGTKQLSCY